MTRIAGSSAAPRAGARGKIALWALLVIGLVLAAHYFDAPARLRVALDGIARLGSWGPAIFALLYVAATVFFLPGSILTVGAGVVFGLVRGFAIVSISATLGATAAFLVGRYLARDRRRSPTIFQPSRAISRAPAAGRAAAPPSGRSTPWASSRRLPGPTS